MFGVEASVNVENERDRGDLTEATQEALLRAADAGFERSQELVATDSTDTGFLLRSGQQPTVTSEGVVEWGYTAPHAPYVEFGTPPHWPPIEPLLGWARRVLGDESAAYAVQRAIAENGTDPQPFFRPGIETMVRQLDSDGISADIDDTL